MAGCFNIEMISGIEDKASLVVYYQYDLCQVKVKVC